MGAGTNPAVSFQCSTAGSRTTPPLGKHCTVKKPKNTVFHRLAKMVRGYRYASGFCKSASALLRRANSTYILRYASAFHTSKTWELAATKSSEGRSGVLLDDHAAKIIVAEFVQMHSGEQRLSPLPSAVRVWCTVVPHHYVCASAFAKGISRLRNQRSLL